MAPLSSKFDLLMGQSPPSSTYHEDRNDLPFFQGQTDFSFRFPENRKYCSVPKRIGKPDDTLFSVRAPVGDITVAAEECCIGQEWRLYVINLAQNPSPVIVLMLYRARFSNMSLRAQCLKQSKRSSSRFS